MQRIFIRYGRELYNVKNRIIRIIKSTETHKLIVDGGDPSGIDQVHVDADILTYLILQVSGLY